jgi:hypothetical protein
MAFPIAKRTIDQVDPGIPSLHTLRREDQVILDCDSAVTTDSFRNDCIFESSVISKFYYKYKLSHSKLN